MYREFANVYDLLMRGTDYDAWAKQVKRLLRPKERSVLECACGTGEMSLRLYLEGYDVIASDLSENMLRLAAEKARRRGAAIPFVQMDMQKLAIHRPADAVLSFCDGVNYLCSEAELSAFFRSARGALKEGGAILFDVSTAYKLSTVLGCNTFADDRQDCAYFWQNHFDPRSRLIEMRLTFFLKEGPLYRRFDERQVQRAHTHEEIVSALTAAGFDCISAFDGYTDRPVKNTSERAVYFARRSDGKQS